MGCGNCHVIYDRQCLKVTFQHLLSNSPKSRGMKKAPGAAGEASSPPVASNSLPLNSSNRSLSSVSLIPSCLSLPLILKFSSPFRTSLYKFHFALRTCLPNSLPTAPLPACQSPPSVNWEELRMVWIQPKHNYFMRIPRLFSDIFHSSFFSRQHKAQIQW